MFIYMKHLISLFFVLGMALAAGAQGTASSASPVTDQLIAQGVRQVLDNIRAPVIPERTVNLITFSGHEPDATGSHDFVGDIEKAIAHLSAQGGGRLLFAHPMKEGTGDRPVVVYRVRGPINLRSCIELRLEPSIRIQFEFDPASYLPGGRGVLTRYEGTSLYTRSPLIRAFNAHDFAITAAPGPGTQPEINGDGKRWREWEVRGNQSRGGKGQEGNQASYMMVRSVNDTGNAVKERRFDEELLRPPLMEFLLCRSVLVEGIKITNSPFWCVHPVFSESLIFRRIRFEALVANNDGIDPESSRYVLIEDIDFHNADDNVAIKSGRNVEGREGALIAGTEYEGLTSPFIRNGRIGAPTEHVLVRNCRFRGHYAMCIGSEMSGGAHHIYVLDNESTTRVNMGFYIKGGRERGGTVSDVFVRNMRLNEVQKDAICLIPNYDGDTVSTHPSKYHNIYIENLTVKKARGGIRIYGWADQTVDDVLLRNISVDKVETTPFGYNHVRKVQLENVRVNGQSCDGLYDKSDPAVPTPRAG